MSLTFPLTESQVNMKLEAEYPTRKKIAEGASCDSRLLVGKKVKVSRPQDFKDIRSGSAITSRSLVGLPTRGHRFQRNRCLRVSASVPLRPYLQSNLQIFFYRNKEVIWHKQEFGVLGDTGNKILLQYRAASNVANYFSLKVKYANRVASGRKRSGIYLHRRRFRRRHGPIGPKYQGACTSTTNTT